MARRKTLTDLQVKAIRPPPEGKRLLVPDPECAGHYVRVTDKGKKTFFVVARRPGGTQLWREVGGRGRGAASVLALAEARDLAREGIKAIKRGEEPWPEVIAPDTFGTIAARFIAEYARPRNRSWEQTDKILARLVLPQWKNRLIGSLTRRDVIELVDTVAAERGGIMANRTLAAVRKLFNWAARKDIITATPAADVGAPAPETPRDRVLTGPELVEVWRVADPYVRLLILTAQRRSETAAMRWADLDLESNAPAWTIPADMAKNGKAHIVPLPPEAVAILKGIDRIKDSELVFTNDGETVATNFGKRKTALDKAILEARQKEDPKAKAPEAWTLHDIRRSVATGLQSLGVRLEHTEAILNHKSGSRAGIVAVYQRHEYAAEKRAALTLWARHVAALVEPAESNVVELRAL